MPNEQLKEFGKEYLAKVRAATLALPEDGVSSTQKSLTVIVQTYNHERFIEDCLKGVLDQRTDFPVEVIVGDDDSPDRTQSLVTERIRDNVDPLKRFRLLFHEKNLSPGMPGKLNIMACLASARGKYVIICDGDDYFTDPDKLQVQVDFLESHPQYIGVFHAADWLVDATGELIADRYRPYPEKETFSLEDLLLDKGNPIPMCSLVYRNTTRELPQWFYDVHFGDYAIHLINLTRAPYAYMNRSMAVYREHGQGAFSGVAALDNLKKEINLLRIAGRELGFSGLAAYKKSLFNLYLRIYNRSRKHGNTLALPQLARTLAHIGRPADAKLVLKYAAPGFYRYLERFRNRIKKPGGPSRPRN